MNDINMPCSPEFLLVLFGYRNVSRTSTKRPLSLLFSFSFLESCKNIYTLHMTMPSYVHLKSDTVNLCSNPSYFISHVVSPFWNF